MKAILSSVAVLYLATVANGQDEWLKKRFMPTVDAKYSLPSGDVPVEKISFPLVVTKVDGDWLWVGKAWVQKSHVVPLDSAVDYYTTQLRSNSTSRLYILRGIAREGGGSVLFDDESKTQVLSDYTEAIRLDATNYAAYHNRGLLRAVWDGDMFWNDDDELDLAMKDFDAALRLKPSHAQTRLYRGLILSWKHIDDETAVGKAKLDEALREYSEFIKLAPNDELVGSVFEYRAGIWRVKGELEKAIADYTEAIRHLPKWWALYMQRGHCWGDQRKYDNAIADFTAAMQDRDEEDIGYALYYRGLAWLKQGNQEKAKTDFAEAFRVDPELPEDEHESGSSYNEQKRYSEARDAFFGAVQLNPAYVSARNSLAWLLATCPDATIRDGRVAVEHASKACELTEWKDSAYVDTLAAAHAEAGDFKEAIRLQKKAIELAPDDKKDNYRANLKLFKAGQPYHKPAT